MIEIDGSFGEGGGQILRTALSLSCIERRPFRIFNIRRSRKKPGLMPQHLTAVRAAQMISGAEVRGADRGSTELCFVPGAVNGGDFVLDIGTAGSTSLVLQTLVPALAFSGKRSRVILTGGTHVPFSPSFHYLADVFAPCLERLGIRLDLGVESYGFYPRGGGRIRAEIFPAKDIRPLRVCDRGGILGVTGRSGVGNLPLSIAERQRKAVLGHLAKILGLSGVSPRIKLMNAPTPGRGSFLFLRMESEHSLAGFTALGAIGKRAEVVGAEAAEELVRFDASGAALDRHLADQIVLYLALCDEASEFTVEEVTPHLLTNLGVIGLFRPLRFDVEGKEGGAGRVRVNFP